MKINKSFIQKLTERPSILFVTSQLRQREIKMAYALKSQGWVVGLIYYDNTPFKPDGYFDFFLKVNNEKRAYKIAKTLKPKIIHIFSGAIDNYVLLFCRNKIAPTVIDLNDVFSPALMDYCKERYHLTHEALYLTDGFCARDLQVKRAEQEDLLTIPKNIIFFPEYCWNDEPITNVEKVDSEIHIVSVGTVSLETYGMYDCCHLKLVQFILEQDIHFHIYLPWSYQKNYLASNVSFEKDYADFIKLAKKYPKLHIHDSLPAEKLKIALQQYDFGIISGGFSGFGQRYTHFKPAYVESCYSGRITDYLDANLPILLNEEVAFNHWLLKRYGVLIDLKEVLKPNFKNFLQRVSSNQKLKENVLIARNRLSILQNAPRLATFYNQIIKNTPRVVEKKSIFKRLIAQLPEKIINRRSI